MSDLLRPIGSSAVMHTCQKAASSRLGVSPNASKSYDTHTEGAPRTGQRQMIPATILLASDPGADLACGAAVLQLEAMVGTEQTNCRDLPQQAVAEALRT